MKIILTCGHAVPALSAGYPVMTKAVDKYGEKAVSHRVVCGDCHSVYRQQGEFFETEDHAQEWLLKKGW